MNNIKTFTFEELEAIADLIQFHDDWDELSDRLEVNIKTLFDKVCDLQTELNEGAYAFSFPGVLV